MAKFAKLSTLFGSRVAVNPAHVEYLVAETSAEGKEYTRIYFTHSSDQTENYVKVTASIEQTIELLEQGT